MAVRKDESRGKWLAEAYVKGKRVRRWFDTKGEANRFFNTLKQENSPLSKLSKCKKSNRNAFLNWWRCGMTCTGKR